KVHVGMCSRVSIQNIEQDVRCVKVSAASRQSIEQVCAGVGESSAAAQTCPVKHIAKAKDPRVPLVITADLTATSKATIAGRDSSAGGNVSNLEIRPCPTNVAADVTPGPKIWRWRWRYISWSRRRSPPRQ